MVIVIKVSLRDKYAYSCGNLSYGVILQVISSFFVFFATSVLHVSGSVTGFLVFLSVIWDAITDPVMGYLSDNTYSRRFGKRHGYMLIGAIGLAISNALLWSLRPEMPAAYTAIALFVFMWCCKTFITIFATPYTALGAEMTNDYDDRTSIQTIKSAFFLIGIALPTVLGMAVFFRPTAKYPLGQLNPDAYLTMGLATSALSLICAVVCILRTQKYAIKTSRPKVRKKATLKSMVKDMVSPLKLPTCRYVIFGYLWQNTATAVVTTLTMHVFTYTFLLSSGDVAVISGSLLAASVLSQAYWFKRTMKKDKKGAVLESVTIALGGALVFALMVVFRHSLSSKGTLFVPFAVIMGFAMGGMVSIPQTMLVDTIDLDEYITGKRKEGTMFGCMTFFYKLSQSATIFLTGIFLDLIQFDASKGLQSAKTNYLLGFSLPAALLITLGLAYYCFSKYTLTKDKVCEIQQKLRSKDPSPGE